MTIAAALYAHLSTAAEVVAIAGARVYPLSSPELQLGEKMQPTVVFRLAARRDEFGLDGPISMAVSKWEIACMAMDHETVHELAEAVIGSLAYYKGLMGGAAGVDVQACSLEDASEEDAPELGCYLIVLEFEVSFR